MSDGIELLNGTDPLVVDNQIVDSDRDGLSNQAETKFKVDPANPDTDNDGLSDPFEILLGFDPLHPDTNRDGIVDSFQLDSPNYLYTPREWHF
jgi:flagellar basal body rod protein FlgC